METAKVVELVDIVMSLEAADRMEFDNEFLIRRLMRYNIDTFLHLNQNGECSVRFLTKAEQEVKDDPRIIAKLAGAARLAASVNQLATKAAYRQLSKQLPCVRAKCWVIVHVQSGCIEHVEWFWSRKKALNMYDRYREGLNEEKEDLDLFELDTQGGEMHTVRREDD